jgi:hypothetical protein
MKNVQRQRVSNFKFDIRKHGKLITEPSQTVPDDSYTVKDILTRFTRGIDPMLTRLGQYDQEDVNESLEEEQFKVNPLNAIEDLTDIDELNEFLAITAKNKKALERKLKELQEAKKAAANSATQQ